MITRILDFSVTVRDKAAYRSPTRGLQGNAWKTLLGIAHVGAGQPVVIEACGVEHEIIVAPDPVGGRQDRPQARHGHADARQRRSRSRCRSGGGRRRDVVAKFRHDQSARDARVHANRGDSAGAGSYKASVGGEWTKPKPNDKLRPGLVRHQRAEETDLQLTSGLPADGGQDVPLGSFVGAFEG